MSEQVENEEEAVERGMNELLKEKEAQKAIEEENKHKANVAGNPAAAFISKGEHQESLEAIRKEIGDLRAVLLKAKAQGKAIIDSKDTTDADKIKKLYDIDIF